jgi:hypothetical protein
MQRVALSAITILVLAGYTTAALAADGLVPPGSKVELLYTRSAPIRGGLTEGVAAAPDGSMYFSEIPFGDDKGLIMRFDPRTKRTTVFAADSHKSNGLMFDADRLRRQLLGDARPGETGAEGQGRVRPTLLVTLRRFRGHGGPELYESAALLKFLLAD